MCVDVLLNLREVSEVVGRGEERGENLEEED